MAADEPVRLLVVGRHGFWAEVEPADGTPAKEGLFPGWIPAWYLQAGDDSTPPIEVVSPISKVIDGPAEVRLFPDPDAPLLADLASGRVVRLRRTWGDWAFVEMTSYSAPAARGGWLPAALLKSPEEMEPREGLIEGETLIWFGWQTDFTKEEPSSWGDQRGIITNEKDGLCLFGSRRGLGRLGQKGRRDIRSLDGCTPEGGAFTCDGPRIGGMN